ncbi:hypothetical protein P175DRAFT_0434694 [Aspergillus ochraceoroseus IBT 24754]|uniref:pectinesterase n=1 Tax=Aspergillus ochraceoroseus IBT 24754 TaxID=1392256 RepID=A0A2T5LZB5_9EURO|nr:uncharacterized protein P175DRAFT_0434694 [Aspergillus ochraceoroseus IBT 24754]PTU21613.1 hypothetical protein P175DRAFT_0434694 [Aspergillus ochraceoroseus IBT 24754]
MYLWSMLGFTSLAFAQSCVATFSSSSTVVQAAATTLSTSTAAVATASTTEVLVATDASGQFTAINDAISYAQSMGIPTVTVKAGTYTQAVTVSATATVTVIGESTSESDYSQNQVTIATTSPLTISANVLAIAFRNINFVNTATGNYGAATLSGSQNAFYGCQFVSAGSVGITAQPGLAVIANSYIEALDKVIYGYPSLYLYNTTVVPVHSNALLVYNKGLTANSVFSNSTVVFDSCSVQQKSGGSAQNVYLAAANGQGSVVVYRGTALGGFIAASGVHVDSTTNNALNFYGEYKNTGLGSYGSNSAARSPYVSLLSAADLARFSLAQVFASANAQFATTSTDWVDSDVVAAIESADAAQLTAATSVTTSSSTVSASSTAVSSSIASATSAAATSSATLVVSPNASAGQYRNVSAAIAALPNDGNDYTIYILAGTYTEQISITRYGKVTLRGETAFENDYTQNLVTIEYAAGALTSAGQDESTPVLNVKKTDGSGLALYNINFHNTYKQTRNTAALAADFYGTEMAAYGCSFIGYQDTLLANQGTQVFSNCYIEGSIDFIWGYSTGYFHQCYIATNTPGSCISAQSRTSSTASGGYVFDTCYVTYTDSYGSTYGQSYLGRPYSEYSIAVYMNSYLDKHISALGWQKWSTSQPNTEYVTFGEYNNSGPGAWSSERVSFATNLTAAEAASYTLSAWIGDTSWLDMAAYDSVPSYNLTGSSTSSSSSGANWTHPTSGTVPPSGAVLVSPGGSVNGSYSNLTDALASLPDDSSTQIIFMYAGSYNEQVPSINRDGPVMIIGYQTGNPGQNYTSNEVTITFSHGLSVSPLPVGHSDAETATFSTTSNQIALYNINIINSANLDGATPSYVTLAASIYGSEIGFYGCSFIGWQDTLLTGSTTGYQYYESCYIEGAIDFIWGYSMAYFKGCTIGAKRQKSAITAQSRASSSALGGYVFDQCLFESAPDATVDLTQSVYLGRPYSEYALVVVKNSYLTDTINPAGWKVWSTHDARTDHVTFAEYNNSGPSNWESNAAAREAFGYSTLLTSDTYPLAGVMGSTDWIDMTYWDSIVTPEPASTTTTSNSTTAYNGTTPPAGAYVVSKTAITNVTTYGTIQDALNALPTSSKETPVVFIYPGTYEEQLVVNRSGTTIFMGYSNNTSDAASNLVTIQYNAGVSTQTGQSDSDSATVYATGNYFKAMNINFVNNFGRTTNIASLGFAVRSSKYASLYGCQVIGNQDALLVNGYLFASHSYVEGNVDMIWGSGAGYLLNSTISPNEDGISITADKRKTNTTAGGFVLDQCTVKPAASVTGSLSKISLGRPWNNYARVAYVRSYLASCVEAAGWDVWSTKSPQTDGVLFGEYQNYGPGASTANRASFVTMLDNSTVAQFELTSFFASTSWIDFTLVEGTPFVPGSWTTNTTTTTSITASSTPVPSAAWTTVVTVTDKATAYTTYTPAHVTSTDMVTTTDDIGTTVTPSASFKTVVQKTTISTTVTITEPTVTSTKTTIITNNDMVTITPAAETKTSKVKGKTTVLATETEADITSTIKATSTSFEVVTATAKPVTTTDMVTSTTTSLKTEIPRGAKTTVYTTITEGDSGTKTVRAKDTTTTVAVTSTETTTKTVKTTIHCYPTQAKRALVMARAIIPTSSTVTQYSTVTVTVSTSTVTAVPTTDYVTVTSTKTTGKTTTLKAATSTITSVAATTKVSTETIRAVTAFVTETSTKTVGKTTTLKPSTTIDTITAMETVTSKVKVPGQTHTVTSVKTKAVKSTTMLPRSTVTVSKTVMKTLKQTTTHPASTSTIFKTTTVTLAPSVTITSRGTKTKTEILKTKVTETYTQTKTAKGAKACATN